MNFIFNKDKHKHNKDDREQRYTQRATAKIIDKFAIQGNIKGAIESGRRRIKFLIAMVLCGFTILIWRAVDLMVLSHRVAPASSFSWGFKAPKKIGSILDRNDVVVAVNLPEQSLYVNSIEFLSQNESPEEAADKILSILPNLNKSKLMKKLTNHKSFTFIKKLITPMEAKKVLEYGIVGLHFKPDSKRIYPQNNLLSHVIGIRGVDGGGLQGVEKSFNDLMVNQGKDLQLSIDVRVQHILRSEIEKTVEKFNAKGGAGVIMDVKTGEVLGMSSYPDYDPNHYQNATSDQLFNRATKGLYEVGSVFKAFTMASALNSHTVQLDDIFDTSTPLKVGRFKIHDYEYFKYPLRVPEIFAHSSNIGTSKIALQMGTEIQKKYLKELGLLDKVDINLPEITKPMYPQGRRWTPLSTMTISFGHGIAVSPLHVAQALSSLVNGGYGIKATLLKQTKPQLDKRIFNQHTADTMRHLLRTVVTSGTGRKSEVRGYRIGAKTGTADVAAKGGYNRNARRTTLSSVFPMDNPKYAIVVMIDKPLGIKETHGYATAGWVVAPLVRNIISRLGPMMNIIPKYDVELKPQKTSKYYIRPFNWNKKMGQVTPRHNIHKKWYE